MTRTIFTILYFITFTSQSQAENCTPNYSYIKKLNTCIPKYLSDCKGKFIKRDNKCIHPLYNYVFDVKTGAPPKNINQQTKKATLNSSNNPIKPNLIADQSEYYQNYLAVSGSYYMKVSDRLNETNLQIINDIKNQEKDKNIKLTNFKCSKGMTRLPGMLADISFTEASILERCREKLALEAAKVKSFSAYKYTNKVLRNLLIENQEEKQIIDKIAPQEIKPTDLFSATPEVDTYITQEEDEVVEKMNKELNQDQKLESTCGTYDRICENKPLFPTSGDYTFQGIKCRDVRKVDGDKWRNRYDYECRGNKVVLVAKKYMWVKGASCKRYKEAKKNAIITNQTQDTFIREGKLSYFHHGCANDTMVTIRRLSFRPIRCEDIGKKKGDYWWENGEIQSIKCKQNICLDGPKEANRYIEYAWTCDRYGHVIPTQKFGKDGGVLSITSSGGKRVLIDKLRTAQILRKGGWAGKGCHSANKTSYPNTDICSNDKDTYPICNNNTPIEMSKKEYLSYNDMITASPKRCITLNTENNKCSSKKLKRCFNACRNKCEETKLNPSGLYNFQKKPYSSSNKVINYYKQISREIR